MSPKSKAKELIEKFKVHSYGLWPGTNIHNAKHCALIAVEEIIISLHDADGKMQFIEYWNEVKEEIINYNKL